MNTEELKPEELPVTEDNTQTEQPESLETPVAEESFPVDPEIQLAEEKDRYLRLYSEFENYRRRMAKERLELFQTAGKDIIVSLLPILDDFERAMKAAENLNSDARPALEGFQLIQKKLQSMLESKGLKPLESIGKPFDVEFHEAITRFAAPDESMKGKVIDEVEKGYLLNEHVIRFAKVVVGE
ncbi:MAG: nucleotide exchange factor GrpE [Bacteroidetes bacterium]|nr:nucleotide exchange factor GrpE [Bacteroidota bacterium]